MGRSPVPLPAGDTVCLQCGNRGITNAFVYCVSCLKFAVHRYCLDNIPQTLDEYVRWFCDDCKDKVPKQLLVQNSKPTKDVPRNVRNSTSLLRHNATRREQLDASVKCRVKEQKKRLESSISQQPHGACAKIDSTETSRSAGDSSPVKVDLKKCNVVGEVHGQVSNCSDQSHDAQAILYSNSHAQPKNLNLKEKHNSTSLVVREDGQRQLSSSFDQPCAEIVDCNRRVRPVGGHERGQPVIDTIWEGCFKICNKNYDIFDGLVAHLSVKACEKAYKEANSFPPMLKLEMLPKSVVWPKSFRSSEPTDENIALYFFPTDTKCERGFDYLVEVMMREELAMKAVLMNAELLVFTSQDLPLHYWRFKGKYYLWGVFKGKQQSSAGGMARRA